MTEKKGAYVPRRPAAPIVATPVPSGTTGLCKGCSTTRGLTANGTVRDHMLPLELRVAGVAEPCPGGGILPEDGQLRTPEPPPVVKVAIEKPQRRGDCRICGRNTQLKADGRLSRHLDSARVECDGAGRLPARSTT